MTKLSTIKKCMDIITDNDIISFGGNVLHRSPNRIAKEIALSGRKNLHLVKTAMAYEVDVLSSTKSITEVTAGFIGYESEYGLCNHFRTGVETGSIKMNENACYTVISALRAGAYGIPFIPVRGLLGSDLIDAVGFKMVKDPYSEESLIAVKQIRPDVAFIHVQEADIHGNGRIIGPKYEDQIIARAAKKVVLTCEKIVESSFFQEFPELADISSILVDHVICIPGGAAPGSCEGYYDIDRDELNEFKSKSPENILEYIRSTLTKEGK